jgi:hypothetical protein
MTILSSSCNWDSRRLTFSVTDTNGNTSNVVRVGLKGPTNTHERFASGTLTNLAPGGNVNVFSTEGSLTQTLKTSADAFAIAPNDAGGNFLLSIAEPVWGNVVALQANGSLSQIGSLINYHGVFQGLAARNGVGVAVQQSGSVNAFDSTVSMPSPTTISPAPGLSPWAPVMLTDPTSGKTLASIYDRQGLQLYTYAVTGSSATSVNSVDLSQVMQRSDLFGPNSVTPATQVAGGWYSTAWSTGKNAGTVAVAGPHQNNDGTVGTRVAFANVLTGAVVNYVDLPTIPNAPKAFPYTIASSEISVAQRMVQARNGESVLVPDGDLLVAYPDPDSGLTFFVTIVPDGTYEVLDQTSPVYPSGLKVFEGNIYVASSDDAIHPLEILKARTSPRSIK